jgi:hypothetical protein
MTLSVTLDPILEARVEQEARRLGITQAELVMDTLERALGLTNPDTLLDEICSYTPMDDPNASENTAAKVKDMLRAKHSA